MTGPDESPVDAPEEAPAAEAPAVVVPEAEAPTAPAAPAPAAQPAIEAPVAAALAAAAQVPLPAPAAVKKKPWWQHAWAVVGVLVGIIGAVTGVIGILPIIFRDATDPESLTMSIEPADSDFVPVFAVPLLADWAGFPTASGPCSSEQLAWLEREGIPLHERYLVTVGNDAQEGATMSLAKFRGEGTVEGLATSVAVVCDQTGTGGPAMRAARLDPATGAEAVYVLPDASLPTNPLVFNLAPGESGQFALLVQSSAPFTGDLVFTGSVGKQTWQGTLPLDGELDLPGVAEQRLAVVDGVLACEGDAECDPAQVIAALVEAAGIA